MVDEINRKKAVTKHATARTGDVTKTLGKTAMIVGVEAAMIAARMAPMGGQAVDLAIGGGSTALAGAGAQILGEGIKFVSRKMKTKADARMISSLPRYIHMWSGRVIPGNQLIAVKQYDDGGRCTRQAYKEVAVPYAKNYAVAYLCCP